MSAPPQSGAAPPIRPFPVLDAIDRGVALVAIAITSAAICLIFAVLMTDVVVRYFTPRGLGWAGETPNILFPWLIMGGILLAAQRGAHISVPILLFALRRPLARALLVFLHLAVAATFAALAIGSLSVLEVTRTQVFPITGVPMAYAYAAMLFGFLGILAVSATSLVRVALAEDPRAVRPETEEVLR